jgi:hypothetical protein
MREQHAGAEQEGEGYLVSVSDLMVGLLFVFILVLVAFALVLRETETNAVKPSIEQACGFGEGKDGCPLADVPDPPVTATPPQPTDVDPTTGAEPVPHVSHADQPDDSAPPAPPPVASAPGGMGAVADASAEAPGTDGEKDGTSFDRPVPPPETDPPDDSAPSAPPPVASAPGGTGAVADASAEAPVTEGEKDGTSIDRPIQPPEADPPDDSAPPAPPAVASAPGGMGAVPDARAEAPGTGGAKGDAPVEKPSQPTEPEVKPESPPVVERDQPSEGLRICQEKRSTLLVEIQSRLRQRRVENATIDTSSGVLRLNERALYFEPRIDSLPATGTQREVIRAVADVFAELLPCFTAGGPRPATCRPDEEAIIDAVFVEGHTDRRPFRLTPDGKDENYGLSARRALNVYELMKRDQPRLWELRNREQFAIMGMSGYGPERPVPGRTADTQEDWAANRRIEFRFLLDPLPCSRLSPVAKDSAR